MEPTSSQFSHPRGQQGSPDKPNRNVPDVPETADRPKMVETKSSNPGGKNATAWNAANEVSGMRTTWPSSEDKRLPIDAI